MLRSPALDSHPLRKTPSSTNPIEGVVLTGLDGLDGLAGLAGTAVSAAGAPCASSGLRQFRQMRGRVRCGSKLSQTLLVFLLDALLLRREATLPVRLRASLIAMIGWSQYPESCRDRNFAGSGALEARDVEL